MTSDFIKISSVLAKSLGLTTDELIAAFGRAQKNDLAGICELHRLGFGVKDHHIASDSPQSLPSILSWRYFDFSTGGADFFVLRYRGQIIGAVGAEAIKVQVNTSVIKGVRAADIVVHPDYLKLGIGAWMNLYLQQNFLIVMAMGANDNSVRMVRRMYTPINCRHHFKVLFSINAYLCHRGWPPRRAAFLSAVAKIPLLLRRYLYSAVFKPGYATQISADTKNLAAFFNHPDYVPRQHNTAIRSFEYCRWRFDHNPKSRFVIIELYQQGQVVGYGVVRIDKDEGHWLLMDWDLLPNSRNAKTLHILLSAVIKYVAKQNASSLGVMASDSLSFTGLLRSGFSHRATEDGLYVWADEQVDKTLFDKDQWFISFADTDEAL